MILFRCSAAHHAHLMEVLYHVGGPVTGFPAGWTIHRYGGLRMGGDEGWASAVEVMGPAPSNARTTAIYGQRPGQYDGPVELLRIP